MLQAEHFAAATTTTKPFCYSAVIQWLLSLILSCRFYWGSYLIYTGRSGSLRIQTEVIEVNVLHLETSPSDLHIAALTSSCAALPSLLVTVLPGNKLSQVMQSEPKSQTVTIMVYLSGLEDYCSTQWNLSFNRRRDFVVDWEQEYINREHLSKPHLTDFDEKTLKVWIQLFCFLSCLLWIWNFLIWGHCDFQPIQMKDWIARERLDCSFSSCPASSQLCLSLPRSRECVWFLVKDALSSISMLFSPLQNVYICISHKQKKNKTHPTQFCVRKWIKKNIRICMAVHWTELIRTFIWLIWVSVKLLWHGTGEVDRLEVRQGFSNAMFCELQEVSRGIHL